MDIHMPALRTPHMPTLRRSRPERSTRKAVIASVPGVLAAIGATTWAFMRRRSRATPQERAADKAKKKHKKTR